MRRFFKIKKMENTELQEIFLPESKVKAYILKSLNYGQYTDCQNIIMSGATMDEAGRPVLSGDAMIQFNKKKTETAIVKFIDAEGTEKPFTRDMMNKLSVNDGTLLSKAVDELFEVKKK